MSYTKNSVRRPGVLGTVYIQLQVDLIAPVQYHHYATRSLLIVGHLPEISTMSIKSPLFRICYKLAPISESPGAEQGDNKFTVLIVVYYSVIRTIPVISMVGLPPISILAVTPDSSSHVTSGHYVQSSVYQFL